VFLIPPLFARIAVEVAPLKQEPGGQNAEVAAGNHMSPSLVIMLAGLLLMAGAALIAIACAAINGDFFGKASCKRGPPKEGVSGKLTAHHVQAAYPVVH
jgi:hypothetical protein